MKLPPSNPRCHLPVGKPPADPGAAAPLSPFRTPHPSLLSEAKSRPVGTLRTPHSERAMALVITLILLSVITFMAIAFLVISRAEKGAVTTTTDQALARLAADTAFERAQAELLAPIMCSGNSQNYGLIVSTNYINAIGFIPGLSHPTNVNYEHTIAGTPLTQAEQLQNLTNLLYNPRPPVFLLTNRAFGYTDFRFYLDLNRNGRYDTNGLLPVISDDPAKPFINTNGFVITSPLAGVTVSNFFVGDPEWIGGLEFPDRHYAPDNKFVYRYAYLVVPAGNTLDLNYIHNYAKVQKLPTLGEVLDYTTPDGFFRNQGVGSWEINLAAFLVDLNTNIWQTNAAPYTYYCTNGVYTQPNRGVAFDDAFSLLRYRYAANRGTLLSAGNFFGPPATFAFPNDFIDGYSAGPPMEGTWWSGTTGSDADTFSRVATYPWSGANNTNRFFTIQELFDPKKNTLYPPPLTGPPYPLTFTERLVMAGKGQSSYNRYTFYRLLSQLGTDSAPEVAPAMPKPVASVDPYGGGDMVASATNHGFFSGDVITLTAGNPPAYQHTFKIQVLDAHRFVMLNPKNYPLPPAVNIVAVDPTENAKIDVNYDNINYPRGTFTAWDPAEFFTAAADRMLRRQNGMFLNNIPVWRITKDPDPASNRLLTNNFYTPSLHRVLQLAASIYDSTTTNRGIGSYAPTIFRPIFRRNSSNEVYIVGYRQVRNTQSLLDEGGQTIFAELETGLNLDKIQPVGQPFDMYAATEANEPLVSGIPLILGAKKGQPNFNEFAMQNVVQVSRRLRFTRPTSPADAKVDSTNQIYTVGITNNFGVEAWNSYASNYPRPLRMIVYTSLSAEMTNELGSYVISNRFTFRTNLTFVPNFWKGYNKSSPASSFIKPLAGSVNFLNFSTYNPVTRSFMQLTNQVANPSTGPFYVPHWWLTLNNRVRFILVADETNIVDYVNLNSTEKTLDLTYLLGNSQNDDYYNSQLWSTNRWGKSVVDSDRIPTYGVLNQILASYNDPSISVPWKTLNIDPSIPRLTTQEQNGFFYNLFGVAPMGDNGGTYYRSNIFYAPYVPVGTFFSHISWQANDPLVHYTVGDLVDLESTKTNVNTIAANPALPNLGVLNTRYAPWGYSSSTTPTVGRYELAAKDPLVTSSDAWDFPTNKLPNVGWLGRVHRGTPWQTVYLKSATIDTNNWAKWSGNPVMAWNLGQMDTNVLAFNAQTNDAAFTLPVNDRTLFDIFTTAFNDNAAMGRMSVNQTNLAAWSAILSGVIVLANTTAETDLNNNALPQYGPLAIEPAGVYNPFAPTNTYPAVARMVHGINHVRSAWPGKTFTHLGDILAAPELTVASPFLNTTNAVIQQRGISDAAYERIPQQILGLLKCDPLPRFVIYSYGQALKPADRSLITSGSFLGLCTNYQITAEVATRAVVRIEGAPKNPHAVIESFNPLPPD